MDWISAKVAGELWGITTRRVQVLCGNNQIAGATRFGKVWLIPKDAIKPIDGRTKEARHKKQQKPE